MTEGESQKYYGWLEDAIGEGADTTIVTSSRRLARDLRGVWDQRQLAAGKKAWRTPTIAYWPDWLVALSAGDGVATSPYRLGTVASSLLWERCLHARAKNDVINFNGLVRQAERTWRRLCEWQVPFAEILNAAQSEDEIAFAQAARDYRELLADSNWVDQAGLAELVFRLLAANELTLPGRVAFTGFNRLTPSVASIATQLEQAGCEVRIQSGPQRNRFAARVEFSRESDELLAAGRWARRLLDKDPDARVGIVCGSLEVNAENILRFVKDGATPGWQYGDADHRVAVGSSYGRQLARYPVVTIALLALRWCHAGLGTRDVSVLLRSRFLGGEVTAGRAQLELYLRQLPDRVWTPAQFLRALPSGAHAPEVKTFAAAVLSLATLADQRQAALSPTECITNISSALANAAWPGIAVPSSEEFQLLNRWRELLNEVAMIGAVTEQTDAAAVIRRMSRQAADIVWQPEQATGRIQVLGILEAAGLEFDGLWITGMDADQWPMPSRPLPFVPIDLQRRYDMPDATPADTLAFSRRVLRQLLNGSDQCVLSWSAARGDMALTRSTLLDELALGKLELDDASDGVDYEVAYGVVAMEQIRDSAPPVHPDEHIRGGASIVQRQFVEPFSAFVVGRLGVRAPDEISAGLSASLRGNLIHDALHNLFRGKPTRSDIESWSSTETSNRIGSAVDSALTLGPAYDDPVVRKMLLLERARLQQLLRNLCAKEILRDEFSIAHVEHKLDYAAMGMRLGLRVDRVDALESGELLVIDYKTGQEKTFLNQQGDLTDLQLIVYADALGNAVGGISLINVDSRKISYRSAGNGPLAKQKEAWPETFAAWRALLHENLRAFAAGDVRVNWLQKTAEARPLNMISRFQEQKRAD